MHSHNSCGHDHFAEARKRGKKAMTAVLILTLGYLAIELVAAYFTGSLALLADAGHMFSDVAGLILALVASSLATRKPSDAKTYGYYRTEVLAALVNGVLLLTLSGYILVEAYDRLMHPTEVLSGWMLIVAIGGLAINLIAMKLLSPSAEHSINARAAYLEVVSDMLGSAAVILAGLVIMFTGWTYADPIVSALIGLWMIPRTWIMLKECVHILMEGTPARIELKKLRAAILKIPGVVDLHDLHVWTITSSKDAMSAHILIAEDADADAVLAQINEVASREFDLHHTTVQVERVDCKSKGSICREIPAD